MIPINAGHTQQLVRPGSGGTVLNIGSSTVSLHSNQIGTLTTTAKPASPQRIFIKSGGQLQPGSILVPKFVDGSIHQVQGAGGKVQYIRLVTSSANMASVVKPATVTTSAMGPKNILPAPVAVVAAKTNAKPSQNQRLILPAAPPQITMRPAHTLTGLGTAQTFTTLPPGATVIQSSQQLPPGGLTLVPAQYVVQGQFSAGDFQKLRPVFDQHGNSIGMPVHHDYSRPVLGRPPTRNLDSTNPPSSKAIPRPKKPCNCTKSQCLKLYCECFANGEFCQGCNCANCYNNLEHEDERSKAIKSCLERNPMAFHPKIGKGKSALDRRHNKGCNCKRSGCLKNYCECYEAKILCSNLCKCSGCKNIEEGPDKTTLMHLADAAEVRKQQQTAAKSRLSSQINDVPYKHQTLPPGERLPYNFITQEVVEATCSCLIAQAEEAERTRQIDTVQERMILEEFGRCLMQVIESANNTRENMMS